MMLNRFLNSKQRTITIAAAVLAASALVSRLLGLFRDNLLANLFDKAEADIYFAAFRIPDFVYGVLITGGIVAVFLPLFTHYFKKSQKEAENFFNTALTFYLVALFVACAILAIFTSPIVELIVPGFSESQKALTVSLTRLMFLSPILLGVSSIFSSLLHYFKLFLAYSLAPIFYNLGIIFGILFLRGPLGIKGVAVGVVLGALAHLLIQISPVIKRGFRFRFCFNFKSAGLRKLFKLTLPRVFSSAAYHINLIVMTAIASTLGIGSIRIFNFANNLQWVPVGLIGIPFATAAFPTLCRHFSVQQKEKFIGTFSKVFSRILFLIIPATALMFLLRVHLVRLILGTSIFNDGHFGWLSTRLTAASLGVFTVSLFAVALIPLISRAFFALQDTKTPVKIAIFSVALNIALCYFFIWALNFSNFFQGAVISILKLEGVKDLSVLALPLALSLSSIVQFFLLMIFLKGKVVSLNLRKKSLFLAKILVSTVLLVIVSYLCLQVFSLLLDTHKVWGLLLQTVLSGLIGLVCYILFSFRLNM